MPVPDLPTDDLHASSFFHFFEPVSMQYVKNYFEILPENQFIWPYSHILLSLLNIWLHSFLQWQPSSSLICPLTARAVGAPQIILQLVSSIFPPVLHCPLGLDMWSGQWAGPLDLYWKEDTPALHKSLSYGWISWCQHGITGHISS